MGFISTHALSWSTLHAPSVLHPLLLHLLTPSEPFPLPHQMYSVTLHLPIVASFSSVTVPFLLSWPITAQLLVSFCTISQFPCFSFWPPFPVLSRSLDFHCQNCPWLLPHSLSSLTSLYSASSAVFHVLTTHPVVQRPLPQLFFGHHSEFCHSVDFLCFTCVLRNISTSELIWLLEKCIHVNKNTSINPCSHVCTYMPVRIN